MSGNVFKDGGRVTHRWYVAILLIAMSGGDAASAKPPPKHHVQQQQEDRPPVVLDTQTGIHDGQSGVVLQTAPLNQAPIVVPAPIQQPVELQQQGNQMPIVVAPYVRVPATSGYRQ